LALLSVLGGVAALGPEIVQAQAGRDYGPDGPPVHYPDPDIISLDPRFKNQGNSAIQRLWTGGLWLEGPAWNGQGRFLLWSDIPNNMQLRRLEDDGHVSIFRSPSGNSNGNTFDWQGRQISMQHGERRVVRYEHALGDGVGRHLRGQAVQLTERRLSHPNGSIFY
jgi:gluconolactonase